MSEPRIDWAARARKRDRWYHAIMFVLLIGTAWAWAAVIVDRVELGMKYNACLLELGKRLDPGEASE